MARGPPAAVGRCRFHSHSQHALWFESLALPAKRLEHQLGQTIWCPDYLGDNARQTIVPQFDGRLLNPTLGANISEYNNPDVNQLIDRALAEPHQTRRATLWGELDQRIMRDAPLVPLLWERYSFQWASRVHGWVYDPWTVTPDLTARGWTRRPPDRGLSPGRPGTGRRGDRGQQVSGGVPAAGYLGRTATSTTHSAAHARHQPIQPVDTLPPGPTADHQ